MPSFVAHYRSLDSAVDQAKGLFEFESEARLGSKGNQHDARVKMLELFGNRALSWSIDKIEKKKAKSELLDGQFEIDFRDPVVPSKRKKKKDWW